MSAETLQRAAALMRERALVAAQTYEFVPARVDIDREGTCDVCAQEKHLAASYPEPGNDPWLCVHCAAQADYDASWHPAVALAVADWLEVVLGDFDNDAARTNNDYEGFFDLVDYEAGWFADHPALAVARTYLGESP